MDRIRRELADAVDTIETMESGDIKLMGAIRLRDIIAEMLTDVRLIIGEQVALIHINNNKENNGSSN